jgi:hypothetical protein
MDYRLGLKPHVPSAADLQLEDFHSFTAASDLPAEYGVTGLNWGMLGNDEFGDCFWASAAHETMALAHLGGRPVPTFSTESVLSSYCSYLGIQRKALNEKTDEGTDARQGAKARATLGVADAHEWDNHYQEPGATGHRIGAYLFDESRDPDKIRSAIYTFGAVEVCVNLQAAQQETFSQGFWEYDPKSKIDGGHAITGCYVKDGKIYLVSWGGEIEVGDEFFDKLVQTVIVYISGAQLDAAGVTPNGLNKAALVAALKERQG